MDIENKATPVNDVSIRKYSYPNQELALFLQHVPAQEVLGGYADIPCKN